MTDAREHAQGLEEAAVHGSSPWAESARRLFKNRLAVAGLVLLLVMSALVVLAPWVSPHDPTELQPWVGARPPGFTHPDCGTENVFVVGETPDAPARVRKAERVTVVLERSEAIAYRLTVRRGRIHSIKRRRGAERVKRLDLAEVDGAVYELEPDGTRGRTLPRVALEQGARPPQGLLPAGGRVLIFQVEKPAPDVRYTMQLAQGRVASIERDGAPVDSAVLGGDEVRCVEADGRKLVRTHWLGTDDRGRDLASRILYGGRISLLVGVTATLVSLVIGVLYGAVSGYLGGRADRALMGVVDILYAVPFMFVVIILLVLFGRNIVILFVALGAVQWLTMARIVRGQVLSIKQREFVEAARVCGAGPLAVVFRHLLPQTAGPVIVYTTLTVPAVILQESFLSFIGLSVQYQGRSLDSWGSLVHYGVQALGQDGAMSWLLVWPSVAMVLTLFSLNCLGDGLRDAFDPRAKVRS